MKKVKNEKCYLTRKDVIELFSISYPTLWRWTKQGKLQSYYIGGKVLYRSEEVHNSLTKLIH